MHSTLASATHKPVAQLEIMARTFPEEWHWAACFPFAAAAARIGQAVPVAPSIHASVHHEAVCMWALGLLP